MINCNKQLNLKFSILKQIPLFEYADEINDSALFYRLNEIIPQVNNKTICKLKLIYPSNLILNLSEKFRLSYSG